MAISLGLSEETEVQSHLNDYILSWQLNAFPYHEIRGHKSQLIFKDWIETLHIEDSKEDQQRTLILPWVSRHPLFTRKSEMSMWIHVSMIFKSKM